MIQVTPQMRILVAVEPADCRQCEERLVEPNSPLGEAISYMLNHWEKLTLFLRKPGAPLDNNVCERALKKAIPHRKNALFYKTETGAHVGDLFMSLIYTCQLGGVDSFDYLTALQRHTAELASDSAKWMPWTYREMLKPAGTTTNAGDALPSDHPLTARPIDRRLGRPSPRLQNRG